jgi:hypothetical protein
LRAPFDARSAEWRRFSTGDVLAVSDFVRAHGCSLVEVVVAMAMLAAGLTALAPLMVQSARTTTASGNRTMAALLAADKLEQLRALAWTVDAAGLPVSDPALSASPLDALDRDVTGFVDRVGSWTRRWVVQPMPSLPIDVVVLQVRVVGTLGEDVRLVAIRARRAN